MDQYEGVKAYQLTLGRADGKYADGTWVANTTVAFKSEDCTTNDANAGDTCTIPANPLFIKRDEDSKYNTYKASFMMDGREDPSAPILTTAVASTAVAQTVDLLKCIKCSGAVELAASPTKSKDINLDCWNPAGSTIATDISEQK